jgi:hypothetical protein
MSPSNNRGSVAALLIAGAVVVCVALVWVFIFSRSAEPKLIDLGPAPAIPTADGPREADVGSMPIAGEPARSSSLVKATITVMLSKPAWAELPESCEIELIPQGSTPGEPRRQRTPLGGSVVEFYDVLFGNYLLRVEALGFVTAQVPVRVSREKHAPRQVIPLVPAREITGEVRDASGKPVVGIEVSARPIEAIPGFVQSTGVAITDENGVFHIQPLPEGDFWVHAGPLRSPISETYKAELYGERAFVDLRVGPLASVRFELYDELSQGLIAGARVQIQRVSDDGNPGHSQYRPTDQKGVVHFRHLPPGEYAVTVLASKYRNMTRRYAIEADADGVVRIPVLPLNRD